MSKYTTQRLPFSSIAGKKVEADFDGGEVTSDAGVLLLRETEAQVGIISAITSAIHDLRDLRYVDHRWDDPCVFYAWGAGQLIEGYANMRIRGTAFFHLC